MTITTTTIDRSSPIPLYFQLKQILLNKIEKQEWRAGDLISSEQELQNTYGLSRTTVRQTLSDMVNEGLLDRQRGRGTFVTTPKFTHNPGDRQGASDYLRQQGIEPGWQVIQKGWETATADVCAKLNLSADSAVYCLRRLRLANGEAIGHHIAYIPAVAAEYINTDLLETGGSLNYLSDMPLIAKSKATRAIEATLATKEETQWLSVASGDAILHIERVALAENGTPLEFLLASYRGDRFKYQVTI